MPHFIKTGYWALEKNGYKGWLNLEDIMGGGGSSAVSVTKAEVDALITANGLVPGQTYVISGVDVPLYGGTTVVLQAETPNKLALAGHGIFYNPKYLNSQATPFNGYGIWRSTNTYSPGDDAIWGGKHWTNTSGNVGTSVDKYTLSAADWTVVPFDDVNYNVVADIIHYDYEHDMIIRRKDKWDNDVDGTYQWFLEVSSPDGYDFGNPIKDFQWGNGPEDFNTDDYYYLGVQANYVKDSYLECINFIGSFLWFNKLTEQSYMHNNTTDIRTYIFHNTLSIGSVIINNSLIGTSSSIFYNNLIESGIQNNSLSAAAMIRENNLHKGAINSNTLSSSQIFGNDIVGNSSISSNTLTSSYIQTNFLCASSLIVSNNLQNGYIDNNSLSTSNIWSNTCSGGLLQINYNNLNYGFISGIVGAPGLSGGLYQNSISESSSIQNVTLSGNTFIQLNTLSGQSQLWFNTTGTLSNKTIKYVTMTGGSSTQTVNLSTGTIIYGNYSKQIFKNSAGTTRLGYYNASDVFTVVNVNA